MLTFQVLTETASFARDWVPFCKKFDLEPRAPEQYFAIKVDYTKDKKHPDFVKERRAMKVMPTPRAVCFGQAWSRVKSSEGPLLVRHSKNVQSRNARVPLFVEWNLKRSLNCIRS